MKKKHLLIYSIIICVVYITAIIIFAANIASEKNKGKLRTQVRIDRLSGNLKRNIEKNPVGSNQFYNKLNEDIGELSDFKYINISINGNTIYIYPSSTYPTENSNSNLVQSYNKTFNINNNSITIESELFLLRPSTIYKSLRTLFFIIFFGTIITIFIIFISEKREITQHISDEENDNILEENNEIENSLKFHKLELNDTNDSFLENQNIQDESLEFTDESNQINNDIITLDNKDSENIEENIEVNTKDTEKTIELPVDNIQPTSQPYGLYSQTTGLVCQEYLIQRLNDEINRATASEIDLSLFIIKLPEIDRNSEVMKNICNYLVNEFQFKDLIFEYNNDSILGIKLSMEIDEALIFADKLYCEIISMLKNENRKCYIGISSRTVRMISAERLLKETDEAVKHAMEDQDSPIVAFRANTAKYKEFMENN